MSLLFVSDLHLDPCRPAITELFLRFLHDEARHSSGLFILGDLFEAWIGDDAADATADAVASSLAAVAAAGVGCWFIRGNRDFLLGHDYAARCAMRLLPDPCVFPIHVEPVMLSHGDLLCIDDHGYQQFRREVRSLEWQQAFLQRSVDERRAFAAHARAESARHQSGQDAGITDANPDEVLRQLNLYGVRRIVHGHTHRPALHELTLADGGPGQRIVLGDWYEQGSVLRIDGNDWQLRTLA